MIYVDEAVWPFGRMIMCHMIADSVEELHAFARDLGLRRDWFQHKPGKTPHYDISKSKRAVALDMGAKEVLDRMQFKNLCDNLRSKTAADNFANITGKAIAEVFNKPPAKKSAQMQLFSGTTRMDAS